MSEQWKVSRVEKCCRGKLQSRDKTDEIAISEWAVHLVEDQDFEFFPVTIFVTNTGKELMADGYHRLAAYKKAGRKTIPVETKVGRYSEIVLHSAGANNLHGIRQTNADKRKSVLMILKNKTLCDLSSNKIAKHCGVSVPLVIAIREELKEKERQLQIQGTHEDPGGDDVVEEPTMEDEPEEKKPSRGPGRPRKVQTVASQALRVFSKMRDDLADLVEKAGGTWGDVVGGFDEENDFLETVLIPLKREIEKAVKAFGG